LYYGLRTAQVTTLQSLLVANGYLSSANATGFFGSLTLAAVQKFQCDNNIACTGGAGYGIVGPKTRNILNSLASSSAAALTAKVQALQAELASLEAQLSATGK
jgi:peptidoglycan hydrolase-like protein with peptidoglycan-binding domain